METNNKGMAQRAPTASAPHLRQEYDNNSVDNLSLIMLRLIYNKFNRARSDASRLTVCYRYIYNADA